MTTTYDTEFSTETMAAVALGDPTESVCAYYDDPDTYTIAEAWASSPLEVIDDDTAAADNADDRDASRAKLFAALSAGIIGGATLGAVLFGYRPVGPPTVVVPGFGVSTSQLPGQAGTPGSPKAPQTPAAVPGPAATPAEQAVAPNPVAAESKANEEVAAAPNAPLDPGTPPAAAPPVVVDVYVPPLGEKPQPPAPEPPKPEPPVFDPPNIDVVQVPVTPNPNPPNIDVFQVPTLDQGLQNPTVTGLKPIDRGSGSRWTTNLPNNPPASKKPLTSSRATLAKP